MGQFAEYQPYRPPIERFGSDVVRPAVPEDLEAITALTCGRHGLDESAVRPRIQGELASKHYGNDWCVFLAQVGHHKVGFARARRMDHRNDGVPLGLPVGWYLTGVIVDPVWRRRGLGAALTQARVDWLRGRTDAAYFVVNRKNRASISLHEQFGFSEIARGFDYPRADLGVLESAAYELMLPSGRTNQDRDTPPRSRKKA